ncbi:hypothetical protein MKEN_00469500 [Mycena kentingensis (nom. inval.)]|nr:hypothetical protein MKEN_00469500 [Mycena kentingensis (nom. inval.)]
MLFDLNHHVLGETFAMCDIYTVLTLGRVNKQFRAVSLSKQLWLELIRPLQREDLIPQLSPAEIENITTGEIVRRVKLLVRGAPHGAKPTRTKVIHRVKGARKGERPYHLLGGGRYLQVSDDYFSRRTALYQVATGRCIATWQLLNAVEGTLRMDVVPGEDIAVVLHLEYTSNPVLWVDGGYYSATINRLDLTTGAQEEVFRIPLKGWLFNPDRTPRFQFLSADIFVLQYEVGPTKWFNKLLIVDWPAGLFTYVDSPSYRMDMDFLPGLFVLGHAYDEDSRFKYGYSLNLYAMDSLTWLPITELVDPESLPLPTPAPILREDFDVWAIDCKLFIQRDPLRLHSYDVRLYLGSDAEFARVSSTGQFPSVPPPVASRARPRFDIPSGTHALFHYRLTMPAEEAELESASDSLPEEDTDETACMPGAYPLERPAPSVTAGDGVYSYEQGGLESKLEWRLLRHAKNWTRPPYPRSYSTSFNKKKGTIEMHYYS